MSLLAVNEGDMSKTQKVKVDLLNKQLAMSNNGSSYSLEVGHSPSTCHHKWNARVIML
jgi:hypothetical protein